MRIQRILWAAIAASTVMYALVAFFAARNPVAPFDTTLKTTFVMVEYGIAAVIFLVALMWPSLAPTQHPRARLAVRLALFEACALFGLIAAIVARDWRVYLAPWALAFAGFILAFPVADVDLP